MRVRFGSGWSLKKEEEGPGTKIGDMNYNKCANRILFFFADNLKIYFYSLPL